MTRTNGGTIALEEIIDFTLGGDWGKSLEEELDDYVKVKVIRGTEFGNWSKNKAKTAALRQVKKNSLEKRQLRKGDLIVEVSGGGPNQSVGRVVLIDDETLKNSEYPLVCSNFFRQIRLKEGYYPEFVRLLIYKDYLEGKIDAFQTSSTNLRNLNVKEFIKNIEIPDVELEDQQGVAARLLDQINKVSRVIEGLKISRERLIKLKQAILASAVTGKLTEDWREENGDYEWDVVALAEIAEKITDGDHNPPKRVESGTPYLTAKNIKRNSLVFEGCTYLSDEDYKKVAKRYEPKKGDVLITCVGTLGETAVVSSNTCFTIDRNIAVVRPNDSIRSEYLEYVLNSPDIQHHLKTTSGSTAQPHIYLSDLRSTVIALPKMEEQVKIIEKVKVYFDLAEKVEKHIEKSEIKIAKLIQSILSKAFDEDRTVTLTI